MTSLIIPDWPAPEGVNAYSTTRNGGVSSGAYSSLNLGDHVSDALENVEQNRRLLIQQAKLPQEPAWLQQVHGTEVAVLDTHPLVDNRADAAYSKVNGRVCAIMTADCLPVLFCSSNGDEVAAAHAGWRGLCQGVLENTAAKFNAKPEQILAWLGPAIGPERFEVGPEVRDAFMAKDPQAADAFVPHNQKYLANIYLLAKQRLTALGITKIYGGDFCTVTEQERFFSYRRDGETGRMASLIWINDR